MQLKRKLGKSQWLMRIGNDEFTADELKPYERIMRKHGISILQPGERVQVPSRQFTKAEILAAFQQAAQQSVQATRLLPSNSQALGNNPPSA